MARKLDLLIELLIVKSLELLKRVKNIKLRIATIGKMANIM
jgi:hypothetical protein